MEAVSITIIVPVYSEGYNVISNVKHMVNQLENMINFGIIKDFELIVIWGTRKQNELVKDCLILSPKIKVFFHDNMEIGSMFARGIALAEKECVGLVPPYNQVQFKSLSPVFTALKNNDMVAAYIKNPKARPWYRILASSVNTMLVNTLFGLKIRYYHECFYRSHLIKKVEFTTLSHAAMVEAAIWMSKSGARVAQVPFVMIPHNFKSKSGAFRIKNVIDIFIADFRLFWRIMILRERINLN